ncbi:unnamed protein product, partial [Allacma fusca]
MRRVLQLEFQRIILQNGDENF